MKRLRQYIRQILFEKYKLSPEDKERQEEITKDQHRGIAAINRRIYGLQNEDEIEEDRSFLQQYQRDLQSTKDGKALINGFRSGRFTVMHSIEYYSIASAAGKKQGSTSDFGKWLSTYGKNGNDAISCIALPNPPKSGLSGGSGNENYLQVIRKPGFLLKGYPVFVSHDDVQSQTLGSLPKGLVDHQKQSGVAKRPNPAMARAIYSPDFQFAGEVLLDNWTVYATYINLSSSRYNNWRAVSDAVMPSLDNALPCYIYKGVEFLTVISNEEQLDDFNLGDY
jgi:hypothetical protein